MRLSIIVIGDELLLGQVKDTNSGFIARSVAPYGWSVSSVRTVADDGERIYEAIDAALSEADAVITTGGLGPTKDDITKATLCRYFGCGTRFDHDVENNINMVFARRGLRMNDLTRAQAIVPDGCTVIQNKFGTAPVMWFEKVQEDRRKILVSMPGVPFETEGMFPEVMSRLKEVFTPDVISEHRSFIVTDITESDLAANLDEFERSLHEGLHLAYLPSPGYLLLRLDGISEIGNTDSFETYFSAACDRLKTLLGEHLLYEGNATPAQIVLEFARKAGCTVATAESCTGGTIASRLTAIAGASDCYAGSVVSYSNEMKHNALGVDISVIERYGAVSGEVVEQMSEGIRRLAGTDCAIATSGIAGPGGGSEAKPVGTVWIAVRCRDVLVKQCYRFPGNRSRVIDRASTTGLLMLAKILKDFL